MTGSQYFTMFFESVIAMLLGALVLCAIIGWTFLLVTGQFFPAQDDANNEDIEKMPEMVQEKRNYSTF